MKFLNYNWIKIIKKNIRNNDIKKINKNEKKDLIDLVFKKEICALIFIVLNFLITYTSLKEMISKKRNAESISMIPGGPELVWEDDLAIISSPIRVGREDNGKIIVLGPRRMEYNRVVSLVDFIAKQIEEMYK